MSAAQDSNNKLPRAEPDDSYLDRRAQRALAQFAGILAEIALAVASDCQNPDMKGGEECTSDADDSRRLR